VNNLPNIESLVLTNGAGDGKILATDNKLISLKLFNFEQNSRDLRQILCCYKGIKYLRLENVSDKEFNLNSKLLFENLTHLNLNGMLFVFLLSIRTPNLKNLVISCEGTNNTINLFTIPDENLQKVEKLSVCELKIDQIPVISLKFPELQHLNIGNVENVQSENFAMIINQIVSEGQKLRIFGITEKKLKELNITYEELLSQMENKRLILKVYKNFKHMTFDGWVIKYLRSEYLEPDEDEIQEMMQSL
jgi:hypothetical protein